VPETRHRGQAREALLASAAEVFARKGYRATSLDDVAGMLGVRKPSLYYYIHGKQDLLLEIYKRLMDRIVEAVEPIARSGVEPDERLRRMVLTHISVVAEERDMLAVVVSEENELVEPNRAMMVKRKHDYERLFEDVIIEGQKEGLFRDLTPRLLVLGMLGMTNWMYQWFRPGRDSTAAVAGEFVLLLERGWLSDGDDRLGVTSRADSVDDALSDVDRRLLELRGSVQGLEEDLATARQRLSDGLARVIQSGSRTTGRRGEDRAE
jgi:TetR/AcrR family transcriptional regulator, cholesterol catabolism regulator